MRKTQWSVEKVKKSFHEVSSEEMKRRLAEIWEILLTQKSQPVQVTPFIPNHECLLSSQRRQNV